MLFGANREKVDNLNPTDEVEPYRGFARFWEGLGLKGVAKIEQISHISEK
jgi:hypothetical protein